MYIQVILGLAGVFALTKVFKNNNKAARFLTLAKLIALVLFLMPFGPLAYDGFNLYSLTVLVAYIVIFADDEHKAQVKLLLPFTILSTIPLLSLYFPLIPFIIYAPLVGFAPAFFFFYLLLYEGKNLNNQLGFMAVNAAFSLIFAISGVLILINN